MKLVSTRAGQCVAAQLCLRETSVVQSGGGVHMEAL